MAYIALKPCQFAGKDFKIGETIPAELILPEAAENNVKMQVIALADGAQAPRVATTQAKSAIEINVHLEEGDLPLELTIAGIQQIFSVLTGNVENAEKIVAEMTDGDALILLNVCDKRKSIIAATEARAKALNGQKEAKAGDK